MERRRRAQLGRLRRRLHFILDSGDHDRVARSVHVVLIALVVASIGAIVLETVPDLARRYQAWFTTVEVAAVAVFSVEYALRVWCAPEHTPFRGMSATAARVAFVRTPSAIIDLLAVLPVYLAFFVSADLKILLLFRLLRFFKLARYTPGMRSLVAALEAERKALGASAIILFGLVLVAASAMHYVEHEAQPLAFGTIPDAMWWAVVTLTTVGYGDVVPVTLGGRLVASVTMLMGLMMLALPIGIVATAFAEEIHRREFVVTWGMVARVPLFNHLDAGDIAEIMRYLRAQTVPTGTVIVRKGDTDQVMYFIASGEVEVELATGNVKLGEGAFFGEMAVLKKARRMATIRASQPSKLLALDAADLHLLIERNPKAAHAIEEAMLERTNPSEDNSADVPAGER